MKDATMYDKLVNRLRKAAGPAIDFPDTLYDEAADAIEKLIEVVQNHDFLESLIKPRWIPVTEQLPRNESVLIYSKAGGVAEGKYNSDTGEWTQYRWSAKIEKDVTYWMPLPETPKEENAMFKDNQQPSNQPSFGSIGDSISLDDYQTTTGPITGSTGIPINQEYCGYRLPCGICRMTMTQCPKQTVQITWTSQMAR